MTTPRVSIIICTCDRAESLRLTLESLRHLSYPAIEVVVVEGPSSDHTSAVLADFDGLVKRVRTDERNLSTSRNLGIAAAAGEIVAFIDDDALADGTWLDDLVAIFADPEVAGTGGPVLDYTGRQLQARCNIADRWGNARVELEPKHLEVLDHPDTWQFPYPMGTNALFRRERIVALGGFDENFAFYLDETDLCLRLIDAGYRIVPQPHGLVHHKFLPSGIRNAERVTFNLFNVALSRAYFSMRHGLPKSDEVEMFSAYAEFVKGHREDLQGHVEAGRIPAEASVQFNRDAVAAWKEALERAEQPPRTRPPDWFEAEPTVFLQFPTRRPPGHRLRLCVVTADYPPGPIPGIGRASHTLATGLAAAGHLVHVVAGSRSGHSAVDFEEGVWVHRIASTSHLPSPIAGLPQARWDRASSVLDEVSRLSSLVHVDEVLVPNWDAEGLAIILDRRHRTCLYAYTPVLAVAECDTRLDPADPAIAALAEAERISYELADLVMVSFPETLDQIRRLYGVRIPSSRVAVVPLGLPDAATPGHEVHDGIIEVLFVGRLEARKGIDTLLAAIPDLCARHPAVRFTVIGDDSIVGANGLTYRQAFEAAALPDVIERVQFTGALPDEELLVALARCDIFVAPSRFESFGLMNLEAMRASKPVVSTAVNGIASVVRDGTDGILVPPDDPVALAAALGKLIEDPVARVELGANGRNSFETNFTVERMVERIVASLEALLEGRPQLNQRVM
ncbi:MAG: glycosyltransferase [Acidimicrobiaceae bacterium]|nr:glycosyltransferase [Acidimicrobiaceae bacterium]